MPAVNAMSYDKLLLDAMRMVSFTPSSQPLTNEGLVKAMTVNENLQTLGYVLQPNDVIRLAQSPSVDSFYDHVKSLMSTVDAKPMYPDFPTQVMEMDEAQYRMHQLIHYFSTYGLESVLGAEVHRGWLPAEAGLVSDTEKTESDTRLVKASALELVEEGDKYRIPFKRILGKRERMTDMEKEIVSECVRSGNLDFSEKVSIPFKENLTPAFQIIAESAAKGEITRQQAASVLFNICQHPGDVSRNLKEYLIAHKFHLRTAEKKMFVELYEKFDKAAFKENLRVSKRNVHELRELFRRIDFAKFCKDKEKADAVKSIGQMPSWEAQARQKLAEHTPDAIQFIGKRPGMLIRMMSVALRNGYSEEEIRDELLKHSREFSLQTGVALLNKTRRAMKEVAAPMGYKKRLEKMQAEWRKLNRAMMCHSPHKSRIEDRREHLLYERDKMDKKETARVAAVESMLPAQDSILQALIKDRLAHLDTGLRGKSVYLDEESFDLSMMAADPSMKEMSQGYLPSATTIKLPEGVDRIRCFVYWNDKNRVDIDLHAVGVSKDGENVHVGWNADYDALGMVMSGDITHSDAAEFLDVDLNGGMSAVSLSADVYTGQDFKDIETCYMGIMAVDKLGQTVKLYDPANCLIHHDITNPCTEIVYGALDIEGRTLRYFGIDQEQFQEAERLIGRRADYSLHEYLTSLLEAQGCTITDSREDADVVLTLAKPMSEQEVSLIDNNFFYDAKTEDEAPALERTSETELAAEPSAEEPSAPANESSAEWSVEEYAEMFGTDEEYYGEYEDEFSETDSEEWTSDEWNDPNGFEAPEW